MCESIRIVIVLSIRGAVDLSVAHIRFLGHDCLGNSVVEIELADGVGVSGKDGTVGVENIVGEN